MNDSLKMAVDYLRLIYRKRHLFLGVSLLVITIMIGWSYTLPNKYKASSSVFIKTNVLNSLIQGIAVTPSMDERIRVLSYNLASRSLVLRVLEKLNHPALKLNEENLELFLRRLISRIDISVSRQELFRVSLVDKDPYFARDFINTLVSTYVEESLSGTLEESHGAKRFLDEQIDYFRNKLEASENEIIEFRKKQGVIVAVNEESIINDLQQYKREIENIDLSLSTLVAQKKKYQAQLEKVPSNVPLFNETDQESRIKALKLRVRQLMRTFTEDYPEVIRLKAEIKSLENNKEIDSSNVPTVSSSDMYIANPVYQDIQQKAFDLEAEISSLQSKRKHLSIMLVDREKTLREMPEKQKTLAILIQERDSNRRIYQELLARHSQSEVSEQMGIGDKTTTFRIVDLAYLPKAPVSPSRANLILMSVAAGFLAGFGVIFLIRAYSNTFDDIDQLGKFGVPVLVLIPNMKNAEETIRIKRKDLFAYSVSIVYLVGIVALFLMEKLKSV